MYKIRLSILRENNNLNQENIAKILGINRGVYSKYETQNAIMPIKHLLTLCEYYKVSIDYIFGFTNLENYKNNNYQVNLDLSSRRIKNLRKKYGMTQKDLGEELASSGSTIAGYEAKDNIIATPILYDLCVKFLVSADYILGKVDKPIKINIDEKKKKLKWKTGPINSIKLYSDVLSNFRMNKNLKQEDLAKILNISKGTYSKYETENLIMPVKHLITLCKYLGISLDYMLGFTKEIKPMNNKEVDIKKSAKRIKEIRTKNKMTREKFGKAVNSSGDVINSYERALSLISTSVLYDLCKKFNVSADYILGLID